jgi:hypothetical protein
MAVDYEPGALRRDVAVLKTMAAILIALTLVASVMQALVFQSLGGLDTQLHVLNSLSSAPFADHATEKH